MRIYSFQSRNRRSAEAALLRVERRSATSDPKLSRAVARILKGVREGGDVALRRFAWRFDQLEPHASLRVPEEEMAQAWRSVSAEQRTALQLSSSRIRSFAEMQMPKSWTCTDSAGMTLGQRIVPLNSVACYVPSGLHPLPSSLLMTAVPAQTAGVPRIAVFCARPDTFVLADAHLLGITEMYRVGGAHAIAAAAYGTASIARVDKITGPGSAFVTAAKQIVANDLRTGCTIDMPAGPTETLICSDSGNPEAIAADLVAQSEHSADTLAILVTCNPTLVERVQAAATRQARTNPTARKSLEKNGLIFVAGSPGQQRELVNRIAPEHLTVDSEDDLDWVRNAGSVFIGTATPQALGDYLSGPNHTLPTAGFARQRGGLSVTDFCKVITVQSASSQALENLCAPAAVLAHAEGLSAHAESLRQAGERA